MVERSVLLRLIIIASGDFGISLVNTRCIHYRLSHASSSPQNMTLCPVLDFANHTPSEHTDILPVLRPHMLGGDYIFKSSPEHSLSANSEVFLRYGAHANRTLLVEYGFVSSWEERAILRGEVDGEVDVQEFMEEIIELRGGLVAKWTKQVLEDEGYWGYDYHLFHLIVFSPINS